jgi:fatty-acyl-CoA synthase
MMDWDSHRYLECFFAVPMMGAVLHTINVRLSPDQLIYTINHAKDDVILVNAEFLPLLEAVKDQMETVKKIVLLTDEEDTPETALTLDGEYETLLAAAKPDYEFPDFDENAMATTFYTTGTDRIAKGRLFQPSPDRAAHLRSHVRLVRIRIPGHGQFWGCVHAHDAHVSRPRLGNALSVHHAGNQAVYPGKYEPEMLLKLIVSHKVTFSHCVPTIIHMLVSSPVIEKLDLSRWKVVIGGSALPLGLCKAALKKQINIYSAYGMSETCPLLTVANLKPHMFDWERKSR